MVFTLSASVLIAIGLICVSAGVIFISAYLRDKVNKELEEIIADNLGNMVDSILGDPTLSDEHKLETLEILLKEYGDDDDGDWVSKLVPIAGVLGAAWIIGEYLKSR